MTLNDLIGFQLVSITSEEVVVKKDDATYRLVIHDDGGDCCGFNEVETKLLIDADDVTTNPVITNVELVNYTSDDDWDGNRGRVTFFGVYKPLAEIDSYSSSGSGWCYGAAVSIQCEALDLDEIVSQW